MCFGECTPITTSSPEYLRSNFRNWGMMCWQLMQLNVQKSRMTSLPSSCLNEMGLSVLSQSKPGGNSGAFTVPAYCVLGTAGPSHPQNSKLEIRDAKQIPNPKFQFPDLGD